jgi:hypothetical protein
MPPVRKSDSIYQLKITLKRLRPPVWRRVEVPATITLDQLHLVIQIAMGWEDCHLHMFEVNGQLYGVQDDGYDFGETKNERGAVLHRVLPHAKQLMQYQYDFGDSWDHEILVEKIDAPEPGVRYPRCTGGRRACPPEDSGGHWGWAEKLQILADPKHAEYREISEWVPEDHDPAHFDPDQVNRAFHGRAEANPGFEVRR